MPSHSRWKGGRDPFPNGKEPDFVVPDGASSGGVVCIQDVKSSYVSWCTSPRGGSREGKLKNHTLYFKTLKQITSIFFGLEQANIAATARCFPSEVFCNFPSSIFRGHIVQGMHHPIPADPSKLWNGMYRKDNTNGIPLQPLLHDLWPINVVCRTSALPIASQQHWGGHGFVVRNKDDALYCNR